MNHSLVLMTILIKITIVCAKETKVMCGGDSQDRKKEYEEDFKESASNLENLLSINIEGNSKK